YSPLPFVRSLAGQRINTGVWGTAAFPSVYRTNVHAAQFMPHSPAWLAVASLLGVAGAVALMTPHLGVAILLMSAGLAGWGTTLARCALFGWRSDLAGLATISGPVSLARHRALIALMHFLQPLARFYGRVRGMV